ncbi:hypothetical protein ACFO9Q_09130 [Paenibacillus sp. GCM10023252]|uniref:ATP-dependent DNA ligase n=1 Tax=Paenibacillus sp. GCM10023252 TaxID=3252649 RepID=UPI00360FF5CC
MIAYDSGPMLPISCDELKEHTGFLYEPHLRGKRLFVSLFRGQVRITTSLGNEVTSLLPELHHVPVPYGCDVILDGEAVLLNQAAGLPDYEGLMERFRLHKPAKIREAMKHQRIVYYAFDLLYANGQDLREEPLASRKEQLMQLLTANGTYERMPWAESRGPELFEAAKQHGLDGIIAKRKDSSYASGLSDSWVRFRHRQETIVELAGWRKRSFAWKAELGGEHAGLLEPPFTSGSHQYQKQQHEEHLQLAAGMIRSEDRHYVYLQPGLRARIRYDRQLSSGLLIKPKFMEYVT